MTCIKTGCLHICKIQSVYYASLPFFIPSLILGYKNSTYSFSK
nr:MAG TPA: hypothetical protein [Caudoviricetes sp.]